jgi:hypothetical protein
VNIAKLPVVFSRAGAGSFFIFVSQLSAGQSSDTDCKVSLAAGCLQTRCEMFAMPPKATVQGMSAN